MGRLSTTKRRYLIIRQENGKPTYHRTVPPYLRPHMSGQIVDCDGKLYKVGGQATIKIALPSNPKLTEDGWIKIDTQAEEIFLQAQARLDAANRVKILTGVTSISSAQHHRMLDQVSHGILAEDDRIRTQPDEQSDLSWVIQAVMTIRGDGVPTTRKARQMAQDVECRVAEYHCKEDKPQSFDLDIEEGEIADPAAVEILNRRGRYHDLSGDKIDADLNAILKGRLTKRELIESEVAALLARNGMTLPRGHTDRLQMALDMPRKQAKALANVMARRKGEGSLTPPAPEPIVIENCGPRLSETREEWIKRVKPGKKAQDVNKICVDFFIELFGDLPVSDITDAMIREYRDHLDLATSQFSASDRPEPASFQPQQRKHAPEDGRP